MDLVTILLVVAGVLAIVAVILPRPHDRAIRLVGVAALLIALALLLGDFEVRVR